MRHHALHLRGSIVTENAKRLGKTREMFLQHQNCRTSERTVQGYKKKKLSRHHRSANPMEDDMACFDGQEIFSIESAILFWIVFCNCKICLSALLNFDEKKQKQEFIFLI